MIFYEKAVAVLEDPYILLYDKEISDLMDLVPILEEVNAEGRSLVIIAEDVIDKALSGLLLNQVRGIFKVVALKPPGFGDKREDRLKDLAIMTGGEAFVGDFSTKLEHIELEQLGQAKRVIVTADNITIIGGRGDRATIKERINYLASHGFLIKTLLA